MSALPPAGQASDGGPRVPRPIAALLRRVLPAHDVPAVLGDLAEGAARRTRPRRLVWLAAQTASLVVWSAWDRRNRREILDIPSRSRLVPNLLFELRAAGRALRRSPGHALAMIATIAIGIGGTTTVFALVHGVLLAPLEYPHPERLVAAWPTAWESKALFRDIEARVELLDGIAAWSGGARVLAGDGEPELLPGPEVTAGFLQTLGYRPELGRFLEPRDNEPGAPPVVVLTHELFASRYGADPALVGRTIQLDGRGWTVIGVLPPAARLLQADAQIVTPLRMDPETAEYRTSNYLRLVGRLAAGAGLEQASAEMRSVAEALRSEYQLSDRRVAAARVIPLQEFVVGNRRPLLTLLMGAVALVLLVACVNAGNLTLARQLSRRTEVAVRSALGGGRVRGVMFLGSESLVLAATGGLVGTLLAAWALAAIRAGRPLDLPRLAEVHLSPSVLAMTLTLTAAAALAAGILPALRATRADPVDALRGGRGSSMGRGTRLAREGLVVVEVALAVVLVLGAGLMARSLWDLANLDAGFDPGDRLLVQLVPPVQGVGADLDVGAYYTRMIAALESLPSVVTAGSVNTAPVRGGGWVMGTEIEGVEYADSSDLPFSYWRVVSPGYLDALGARLRGGRPIRDTDVAGGVQVAVVNETFARTHWPDQDPLGRRFRISWETDEWVSVVGVVADIRHLGIATDAPPTVYRPLAQAAPALARAGVTGQSLLVHTRVEPAQALPEIRQAIHDVDPTVPLVSPASMDSVVRESLAEPRLLLQVLTLFGLAALLLSAVGIAGVVGHLVRERRREFGIRQALGARPAQIVGRSLIRGVGLGAVGLVLGTVAALAMGPLMSAFVFGVRPRDPATVAVVVAVLGVCVVVASWVPSRAASHIDPSEALRLD